MIFKTRKDGGSELWFSSYDIETLKKDKKLNFSAKNFKHILNNFVKIYIDYEAIRRRKKEKEKKISTVENVNFKNIEIIKDKVPEELFSNLKNESINKDQKNKFISGLTNTNAGVAKHFYVIKNFNKLGQYLNELVEEFLIKNNDYFVFPLFTKDVPLKLTKAWFNYQTKHQHIPSHLHDGLFSFVIWLQIPTENKFIFIYNDILGQTKEKEIILSKKDEGTILLFPSKLRHQVYPFFDTDDERISISGNILFETK